MPGPWGFLWKPVYSMESNCTQMVEALGQSRHEVDLSAAARTFPFLL